MKCWLKNNPVYHKVYEYTEAGTYTITITEDTPCKFVIVGGGGGGAYGSYMDIWNVAYNGGSGAMIQGETTLTAGTYTLVVGSGGTGVYGYSGGGTAGGGTGDAGGNSTFLGNTAGGGKGGYALAGYFATQGYPGAGGTATPTGTYTGTNGVSGDTAGIYKNQYGAGGTGGGGSAEANTGHTGYVMIDIVSDSSDYTYTVDDYTAKVVDDNGTYKAFRR